MQETFDPFDLFGDVHSSDTEVGLLLQVGWWIDLVHWREWSDLVQQRLVMFRSLLQPLCQELLIRVLNPRVALLPFAPRKSHSKDVFVKGKIDL